MIVNFQNLNLLMENMWLVVNLKKMVVILKNHVKVVILLLEFVIELGWVKSVKIVRTVLIDMKIVQ